MNTTPIIEKTKRITETIKRSNEILVHQNVTVPEKELITLREAIDRYGISDYGTAYGEPYDNMVLVFKGDVAVNGNFSTWLVEQLNGLYWETSLTGVFVNGNLNVNGDVEVGDFMKMTVKNNLICDFVELFRGFLEIGGNAGIRYGVLGTDYIGGFEVSGTLDVPYLVSLGLEMPFTADSGESIYIRINNDDEILVKNDNPELAFYENSRDLFKDGVWENNRNAEPFFEMVRQGENPFREQ